MTPVTQGPHNSIYNPSVVFQSEPSRNSYPKWCHFLKPGIPCSKDPGIFGIKKCVKFRLVAVGVSLEPQRHPKNNGPFSQGFGGIFVSPLKKDAWQTGHYIYYICIRFLLSQVGGEDDKENIWNHLVPSIWGSDVRWGHQCRPSNPSLEEALFWMKALREWMYDAWILQKTHDADKHFVQNIFSHKWWFTCGLRFHGYLPWVQSVKHHFKNWANGWESVSTLTLSYFGPCNQLLHLWNLTAKLAGGFQPIWNIICSSTWIISQCRV